MLCFLDGFFFSKVLQDELNTAEGGGQNEERERKVSAYLYMTPSPMTFPMKQAKTAVYAHRPPSGAGGGGIWNTAT